MIRSNHKADIMIAVILLWYGCHALNGRLTCGIQYDQVQQISEGGFCEHCSPQSHSRLRRQSQLVEAPAALKKIPYCVFVWRNDCSCSQNHCSCTRLFYSLPVLQSIRIEQLSQHDCPYIKTVVQSALHRARMQLGTCSLNTPTVCHEDKWRWEQPFGSKSITQLLRTSIEAYSVFWRLQLLLFLKALSWSPNIFPKKHHDSQADVFSMALPWQWQWLGPVSGGIVQGFQP